jgi:hypothetical protein
VYKETCKKGVKMGKMGIFGLKKSGVRFNDVSVFFNLSIISYGENKKKLHIPRGCSKFFVIIEHPLLNTPF